MREVAMRFRLVVDGERREIVLERGPKASIVHVDGVSYSLRATPSSEGLVVRIGGRTHRVRFEGRTVIVDGERHEIAVADVVTTPRSESREEVGRRRRTLEIRPPMPGRVVRVLVSPGMRVARGETLIVLEAMKMQNDVPAPEAGVVRHVGTAEGESVTVDRVVAVLEVR